MNGNKTLKNLDLFSDFFSTEEKDGVLRIPERPESYRQNYFDMAKSFQDLNMGELVEAYDQESLDLLEQWLDNYFPQTVSEMFENNVDYYNPKLPSWEPGGKENIFSAMRGEELQNNLIDLLEGVTPDSTSKRKEMYKEYYNSLKKESALTDRLFSIESGAFEDLDESALNQFNSLAIVQNILSNQITMQGELGVDPTLPQGMPSELDFTPKSRTLTFIDILKEQEERDKYYQKKYGGLFMEEDVGIGKNNEGEF